MNIKEKFRKKTFVKPLYRKVLPKNAVAINIDRAYNLDGQGIEVQRKLVNSTIKSETANKYDKELVLPGVCEYVNHIKVKEKVIEVKKSDKQMFGDEACGDCDKVNKGEKVKKLKVMPDFVRDSWLRVVPLPKLPSESHCSIIFRCIVCQLGIATFLTLWTIIWVFAIQNFEGPYEFEVSRKFEKEQNQLVIELATELRQITPISPKWRDAIEKRMNDERALTIAAIGRGARVHPGQFWDLPGTFLFTIYVMTALGFGAPVPQTIWGRTCALIYAVLAVPLHIYLMVNASTCMVSNISWWTETRQRRPYNDETSRIDTKRESPNCSRNSELIKNSNLGMFRKKLMSLMSMLSACHCVPFAAVTYYVCGAVAFGVMRQRPPVDVVMFPLEFTTSGGLEQVEGYVRVLYGLYIEGAMVLLSCALAALRHRSSSKMSSIAEQYRLFEVNVDT